MDGGFLFSYSDIVFRPEVVRTALETEGDYALVIDRRWAEAYVGRVNHPVEEGEVARVEDGRVTLVGKKTMPRRRSDRRVHRARALQRRRGRAHARALSRAPRRARGQAVRSRAALRGRLPDRLFNDLIESGEVMRPAFIDGGWREIDTVEDLERAKPVVSW